VADIPDFTKAAQKNAVALFDAHWAIAMKQPDLQRLAPLRDHLSQMYVEGYKRGVLDTTAAFMALQETPVV
jgi:hypothetical protein